MADRQNLDLLKVGTDSATDVIKVWPIPADLDPDKTRGEKLLGLFIDLIDTIKGYFYRLSGNHIRGLDLKVRNLTQRDTISQGGTLVVGITAYVGNNATAQEASQGIDRGPEEFRLIKDSQGALVAFVDAEPGTTLTVPARWVQLTGSLAARVGSYPFYVGFNQPIFEGDIRRYIVPGEAIARLFQALTNQPLPGNGLINAAPTGTGLDANWQPFSPLVSDYSIKQRLYISVAQANTLLDTSAVVPGQPYTVDLGAGNEVLLDGGQDSDRFAAIGELRQNGAPAGLAEVDIRAGTFTPYAAGGNQTPAVAISLAYHGGGPQSFAMPASTVSVQFLTFNTTGQGLGRDDYSLDISTTPPTLTVNIAGAPADTLEGWVYTDPNGVLPVPQLFATTGQSNSGAMSQKATTDALKKFRYSLPFQSGIDIIGPDYFELPCTLTRVATTQSVSSFSISLDGGGSYTNMPLAGGVWTGNLIIAANSVLYYKVAFAGANDSAGVAIYAFQQ